MSHPLETRRYTELVSKMSYAFSLLCTYLEKKTKEMDKKEELEKRVYYLEEEISVLTNLLMVVKEHTDSSDK